jgi:solute carrier family 25 carnitine/acylcarnitine transporter 20/29
LYLTLYPIFFFIIKVRMQTSSGKVQSLYSMATAFGGVSSLYRGLAAPLSSACVINALIFSTYGTSARIYDDFLEPPAADSKTAVHDSAIKAFTCGSFTGLVQCVIVCPMEHIKVRLQIQHGKGSPDNIYRGPRAVVKQIVGEHGLSGLYRGWWVTAWREVPAFGMYFCFYDFMKDRINSYLAEKAGIDAADSANPQNAHTWFASALAGGTTGALTWGLIYPIDIIKTQIQTAPMSTPVDERRMFTVANSIVQTHGWRHLFRGLNITLIRAFPVNGIIFPVYEFVLMHIAGFEY